MSRDTAARVRQPGPRAPLWLLVLAALAGLQTPSALASLEREGRAAIVATEGFQASASTLQRDPFGAEEMSVGEPESSFRLFDSDDQIALLAESDRSFHPLQGVELIDTESRRGPPTSYPETRVWAINALGSTFIGVASGVSLDLLPTCSNFSCGFASGLGKDPLDDVDSPNLYGYVAGKPHEGTDPLGLCNACDVVREFVPGFSSDLLNVASIGTYERMKRQRNIGTWGGVWSGFGVALERGVNAVTLGVHDHLVAEVEQDGRIGIGTVGRSISKSAYDMTPMEEGRRLIQESDEMGGGDVAVTLSMAASKSAGLGAMAVAGGRLSSAYREAGSIRALLAIRRAQRFAGKGNGRGIRPQGDTGEAALREVVGTKGQYKVYLKRAVVKSVGKGKNKKATTVQQRLRIGNKSRELDALEVEVTPTGNRMTAHEVKNARSIDDAQLDWDTRSLSEGILDEYQYHMLRGAPKQVIQQLRSSGMIVHDYGPLMGAWEVAHPGFGLVPGMQSTGSEEK